MKKRVLVTGAAGFIGSHLVDGLLEKGYKVLGVDDLSLGDMANIEHLKTCKDFNFEKIDVRDKNLLEKVSKDISAILHLAAFKIPLYASALNTLAVNTLGTENVLEIAREKKCRVLFASTSDVYGKSKDMPFKEDGDLVLGESSIKRWSYGASKIFDEHLCFAYMEEYKLPVTIVRYFNTYGPRHYIQIPGVKDKGCCGPQPLFIQAALSGGKITVHGDGAQKRCFCYVTDTVKGTILALENEKAIGQIFNIGNDQTEMSILDLAKLIIKLAGGSESQIEFVTHKKTFGKFEDVQRRIPDLTKSRTILGYGPCVTNEEGLKITIDWQKDWNKKSAISAAK